MFKRKKNKCPIEMFLEGYASKKEKTAAGLVRAYVKESLDDGARANDYTDRRINGAGADEQLVSLKVTEREREREQ